MANGHSHRVTIRRIQHTAVQLISILAANALEERMNPKRTSNVDVRLKLSADCCQACMVSATFEDLEREQSCRENATFFT